ncbi:MAG TPA: hydantoinase/oxoprolinase family protein [Spirochaetota bacterium]|nr:hydantoinase/oxoprolinase family protein [Spirochaetota bacterium]HPS86122.1 hydantoinase/oxoprolinase family protein [Spirochaetota bacterium]
MLLGIDVGGTHTDAVLIGDRGIESTFKAKTDTQNLLHTVTTALKEVTSGIDVKKITNINLSTTLSTNAIIENKLEKTALFISSGPGIDPENFKIGSNTYIIDGSINHRGSEVLKLDSSSLDKSIKNCSKEKIKVFAAVTKFSTRNSIQESAIAESLKGHADFITEGHNLSSQLSFPRRAATAYYNSAVWRIYSNFLASIMKALKGMGIDAPVNILKADGGTMPAEVSKNLPVESILSGPAASIMGIIALSKITEDSVILDIGGTTTDIAVFASGAPLMERDGISLGGIPTLVRSLQNRSIGIGGDSVITVVNGEVRTGPERRGANAAEGGEYPALVDALNVAGIILHQNKDKSVEAIKNLAEKNGMAPSAIADAAIAYSVKKITDETNKLLSEINQKPVYTIHEMIYGKKIVPKKIYIIGGPAAALAKVMKGDTDIIVPENYSVANAIGAALARTTFETELFSDTGKEKMVIPNLGIEEKVSRRYSLSEAEHDVIAYTRKYLENSGYNDKNLNIDIVESSSFRMIDDYYASGNDIRVKCQIRPGVIMNFHK